MGWNSYHIKHLFIVLIQYFQEFINDRQLLQHQMVQLLRKFLIMENTITRNACYFKGQFPMRNH